MQQPNVSSWGWVPFVIPAGKMVEKEGMYERFTDRSRKIMAFANQEAQRFNHEYIGTEHILLGVIKEGSGVATAVIKNLDVDPRKVRLEVEKKITSSSEMATLGKLPLTPRAKKALDYAVAIAQEMGHNFVGTEHILLGLLKEADGIAAGVLTELGITYDKAYAEVNRLIKKPEDKINTSKPLVKPFAISPRDALSMTDEDQKAFEDSLEKVNDALKRNFTTPSIIVPIAPDLLGTNERVKNAVKAEYEKSGWKVTCRQDGVYEFSSATGLQ